MNATLPTAAAVTTVDMGVGPLDAHLVHAEVDGKVVARITRRGAAAPHPTPGYFVWITAGERRGIVRDLRDAVVYFDTVEDAASTLAWIV